MDQRYLEVLRRNRPYIVEDLQVPLCVHHMTTSGILTFNDCEAIEAETTTAAKSFKLCELLEAKSPCPYGGFIAALEATGQQDIVTKLREDEEGASNEQEPAQDPVQDDGESFDMMDQRHLEVLRRNRPYIVEHLQVPLCVHHMITSGILTFNDCEAIEGETTTVAKTSKLCELLEAKSPCPYGGFIAALEATGQYEIVTKLREDEKGANNEQEPAQDPVKEDGESFNMIDAIYHSVLIRERAYLLDHLHVTDALLAEFVASQIISEDDKKQLLGATKASVAGSLRFFYADDKPLREGEQEYLTRREKVSSLLTLVDSKGRKGLSTLLKALQTTQQMSVKQHLEQTLAHELFREDGEDLDETNRVGLWMTAGLICLAILAVVLWAGNMPGLAAVVMGATVMVAAVLFVRRQEEALTRVAREHGIAGERKQMDGRLREFLMCEQAHHLFISREFLGPFVDEHIISDEEMETLIESGLANREKVFCFCGLLMARGAFRVLSRELYKSRYETIKTCTKHVLSQRAAEDDMDVADQEDTSGGVTETLDEVEVDVADQEDTSGGVTETPDEVEEDNGEEAAARAQEDIRYKDVMEREKSFLLENVSLTLTLWVRFVGSCLVTSEEKEAIEQPSMDDQERLAKLCDLIARYGKGGFEAFLASLTASGQHDVEAHMQAALTDSDVGSSGAAVVISEATGGEVSGLVEEAADDLAAVLARLCVRGSDVNSADGLGLTGLHRAARDGRTDDARTLIRAGANLDARNVVGVTPLHWACARGHTSIVHALVAGGADTQIRNRAGYTPRDWARLNGYAAILELLPP